ncbi:MAG: hypothetical protein IJ709_01430, partial [Selenomonas sp.]|nr:hypothetical protein [Selenomonas sp.]
MIGGLSVSTDVPLAMSRNVLSGELNRYKNKLNHMGTSWSEVLVFEMSFVKDPCDNPDNFVFSEDEVDQINTWLT